MTPIVFLTDYGLDDPFVGVCHAVIAAIAPEARVIDLTHGIPAQDIRHGALVLLDCAAYLPPSIVLAVVDPGVGGPRRAVAVEAGPHGNPWLLVGPDNGLLVPAAERLGGARRAWSLENPAYRLEGVSATFHGRDVFAPAAAHLAAGVDPGMLGPAIEPVDLAPLTLPAPRVAAGRVEGQVLSIDRFGNVQLNVVPAEAAAAGLGDAPVVVEVGGRQYRAARARTFSEVPSGQIGLLEDSFGRMALACRGDSAARRLDVAAGSPVALVGWPGS
jgi:S-adenosyl-L-methionine hydrolase (adenosine-forming)